MCGECVCVCGDSLTRLTVLAASTTRLPISNNFHHFLLTVYRGFSLQKLSLSYSLSPRSLPLFIHTYESNYVSTCLTVISDPQSFRFPPPLCPADTFQSQFSLLLLSLNGFSVLFSCCVGVTIGHRLPPQYPFQDVLVQQLIVNRLHPFLAQHTCCCKGRGESGEWGKLEPVSGRKTHHQQQELHYLHDDDVDYDAVGRVQIWVFENLPSSSLLGRRPQHPLTALLQTQTD